MNDTLDRVVWHALTTRHAAFAQGDGVARCYDPDFAPFAATLDDTPPSLAALAPLVPEAKALALFTPGRLVLPDSLVCVRRAEVEQMVLSYGATPGGLDPGVAMRQLGAADVGAMMALTELTHPGPFAARTIELGHYVGVFADDLLVAMAGERMALAGLVEISSVCTHPQHRGRGLAAGLIGHLSNRAGARGDTPFLHVFSNNAGAISVYGRLGFQRRATMHLAVVRPKS